jgi:hypothetical protein
MRSSGSLRRLFAMKGTIAMKVDVYIREEYSILYGVETKSSGERRLWCTLR